MNVVDLHPEDLLEKERCDALEPAERERLDAHLVRCAVCRMERQLHADFAEELESESSFEKALGLGIERLSAELPIPAPSHTQLAKGTEDVASKVAPVPARRRRTGVVLLLTAAALLVGGAAAAAMGLAPVPWMHPAVEVAKGPPAAALEGARPHPRAVVAPSVAASPVEAPVANAASPLPVAPQVSVASTQLPTARPAAVAHVVGPAELFEGESEARRHGDYAHALDLDGTLEGRYPTSREAQASRAIIGRLLLDRGDPQGALAKFDAYLAAGSGQLGEEAMIGRATALDRLGRNDEALRAWSALVTAFPETSFAAHARARLESSSGR